VKRFFIGALPSICHPHRHGQNRPILRLFLQYSSSPSLPVRIHAPLSAPRSMKIGFSGLVRGDGSVCDTSIAGWRLLGGRETSVRTEIPSVRLTRAGKGTTICRTHKLGRTYSSVCNRPAAQQSPPLKEGLLHPIQTLKINPAAHPTQIPFVEAALCRLPFPGLSLCLCSAVNYGLPTTNPLLEGAPSSFCECGLFRSRAASALFLLLRAPSALSASLRCLSLGFLFSETQN